MKKIFTQMLMVMLVTATPLVAQDGLFISEVADPGDVYQGRFIELYNAGASAVDFNTVTVYLSRQSNGGSTWGDVQLTGSIGAGETYVIGGSSFESLFGFAPDLESGILSGNGDDAYFLFAGGDHSTGTLHDIYGELDVDGTDDPWEYLDSRAVRNTGVTAPNTTWTASEWTIASADLKDFDPGTHDPAGDTDAPYYITGYPVVDNVLETSFDVVVRINEPGLAYYVAMETGAATPSVAEVKAGTGSGGATAVASGSGSVFITESTLTVSGLTADVTYDVFLVIEDDEGTPNTNAAVTSISGTPVTPPTVLFSAPFNSDIDGFTAVSILGDTYTWYWEEYSGNGYMEMSSYPTHEASEDWLISPGFDLDAATGEMLSFMSANNYGDANSTLKVVTSEDFTGEYTPAAIAAATWEDITSNFTLSSGGSWTMVPSGEYDLSDGTGTGYLAFVFEYPGSDNSGTWQIDSVLVTGYVVQGSDANLTDLQVDGATVTDFDAATTDYTVELPAGTTTVPTVTYTLADENAAADQTDATDLTGDEAARTTTIVVTAEDGTTTKTYTILFNPILEVADLAALRAATDPDRKYTVTGEVVLTQKDGYRNKKYFEDATAAIEVDDNPGVITTVYDIGDGVTGLTGKLNDYFGMLQFQPTEDPGAAVSTGNAVEPQVLTVSEFTTNFESYEAEFVKIEGVTFADAGGTFDNGENYAVSVGDDNTVFRTHFYDVITGTIPAMADIQGVAVWDWSEAKIAPRMAGDLMVYSSDASLADLMVDGTSVDGFASGTYSYAVELPFGTTDVPDVTYETTDDNATAVVEDATDLTGDEAARTTTVTVTAQDGTEQVYTIVFSVATTSVQNHAVATLKVYPVPATTEIFVDGLEIGSKLEVMNILGSTVWSAEVTAEQMRIEVSTFDNGIYMILAGDRAVRFIKE